MGRCESRPLMKGVGELLTEKEDKKMKSELYKDRDWLYQKLVVEGLTTTEAGKEIGRSQSVIASWSKKLGVSDLVETDTEKANRLHGKEIEEMYKGDMVYLKDIAEKYNMSVHVVTGVLKQRGVKLKTRSEIKRMQDEEFVYRRYKLNEDYFKTWSSEMAYILGFIAADGCILTNEQKDSQGNVKKKNQLKISLKEEDASHLEKIKTALGFDGHVYIREASGNVKGRGVMYSEVSFHSKELIEDIKNLGIHERKSLNKEIPVSLPEKYEVDYLRGYFDGNGSVGMQYPTNSQGIRSKTGQIRVRIFSGSLANIQQIQEILVKNGLKPKKISSNKTKTVHEICYSTNESIKLYDIFYKEKDSMRLDRKYEDFTSYIKQREQDIKNK